MHTQISIHTCSFYDLIDYRSEGEMLTTPPPGQVHFVFKWWFLYECIFSCVYECVINGSAVKREFIEGQHTVSGMSRARVCVFVCMYTARSLPTQPVWPGCYVHERVSARICSGTWLLFINEASCAAQRFSSNESGWDGKTHRWIPCH